MTQNESRQLAKHTGIMTDLKKKKAIKNFADDIQEVEKVSRAITRVGNIRNPTIPPQVIICVYAHRFGYSSCLSVLGFLVRMEPYTSIFLDQNKRFDDPNRMFSDVKEVPYLLNC